ncbi:MAG TPA: YHS domain-containing protein [Candidatus Anoxymicrobiaceae bacterium]
MAVDPVCGMDVEPDNAAARSTYKGKTYYFCAQMCKTKFDAEPDKYLAEAGPTKAGWFSRMFKG